MSSKRKALVAATAAVALGLTAACGNTGGSNSSNGGAKNAQNAALTEVLNVSDKKGGTLELWSSQDVDSLDPARGYYAFVWNLNRLYTRTLLSYDAKPGATA